MKKINLFLLGLLSIMTFSFVSCSDDDDEVGPVGDLVGKWQSVSVTIVEKNGDAEQEVTRKSNTLGLEFTADGKYIGGEYDEDGWYWAEWGEDEEDAYGSYTYKNGKLTMTDGYNETEEFNVKELTSSKLVIGNSGKYTETDGNVYDASYSIEFRKISD